MLLMHFIKSCSPFNATEDQLADVLAKTLQKQDAVFPSRSPFAKKKNLNHYN